MQTSAFYVPQKIILLSGPVVTKTVDHEKVKLQFFVLLDIDLFFLLAALVADGAAGLAGGLAAGLAFAASGSVRLGQRFRINFLNMFHQKCTSNAFFYIIT